MRDTFVRILSELAQKDKNIVLITGDLGFGVLQDYWETYPEQFINAGVAEQNMTGLAVGMAIEGKTVFTYSIANFPTLRCLEQIRNDAAYHNANIKIVSVGGGFSYGSLGMSHHATEDVAILRALPDVVVAVPGDLVETEAVVRATYEWQGTCYLRLGRGGEEKIHRTPISVKIGQAIKILDGNEVIIFSMGAISEQAYLAAVELNGQGISTGCYSVPFIKPIDVETIRRCAQEADLIVTVEEHNVIGGLGGAVAEVIARMGGSRARQIMVGLEDVYSSVVGNQSYLRDYYGVSKQEIVNRVLESFKYRLRILGRT